MLPEAAACLLRQSSHHVSVYFKHLACEVVALPIMVSAGLAACQLLQLGFFGVSGLLGLARSKLQQFNQKQTYKGTHAL